MESPTETEAGSPPGSHNTVCFQCVEGLPGRVERVTGLAGDGRPVANRQSNQQANPWKGRFVGVTAGVEGNEEEVEEGGRGKADVDECRSFVGSSTSNSSVSKMEATSS